MLLKSSEKQTIDQLAKLGEGQQANQPLYRAFMLKEELRLLYHLNDPFDRAGAPRCLADLGIAVSPRAVRQARPHHPPLPGGILNAIRLGLNNGRLEGLNSRIRLISHRSFGFHCADPVIALIYLAAPPP